MPTSTPRSSPTRTAPPPSSSPSCASGACGSSTSSADFRLRDPAVYAEWYRDAPGARADRRGRLRAARALPRADRRRADSSPTPAAIPTAAILGLAPLARAGLIADVVIDAKSGVSGAGRGATDKTHFVTVDENVNAYSVPRHRHTPEIEQELAALGRRRADHVHAAPAPARPGRAASPATSPRRAASPRTTLDALYREAYADEPFVEVADAPPGVRDVRETNICRISVHRDERTGRVIVFARDRQPVEGHRLPGGPEPQPDVRSPRGGGDRSR